MNESNPVLQELLNYLEQHPVASIDDPMLPASIRAMFEDVDAVACTRSADSYGHAHTVIITRQQAQLAAAAGMSIERYAAARVKYGKA
jgi:hypothetical protein